MAIRSISDNGIRSIPDDTSPGAQLYNQLGFNTPSLPQEFASGIVHGLQEMMRSGNAIGESATPAMLQSALPQQMDAYQLFGTTDKPATSLGGLTQLVGELYQPGMNPIRTAKGAYNLSKNIIQNFRPGEIASTLGNYLGKGAKTMDENAEELGNLVRNKANQHMDNTDVYFNHVLNNVGNEKVFDRPYALTSTAPDKYESVINKMSDLNIGDLFTKFKNEPTIQNAHNLQSELGVMIGDLQRQPITIDLAKQIEGLKGVRDEVKAGITDRLGKIDDIQGTRYQKNYKIASDLYRDNVIPYLSDPNLRKVVREGQLNVPNLHESFAHPTDYVNPRTGQREIGPINKIMQDLPPEARDRILFGAIGGVRDIDNPAQQLARLENAEENGYSKYFNPEVKNHINEMKKRKYYLDMLKTGAKIGGYGMFAGGTGAALMRVFGRSR